MAGLALKPVTKLAQPVTASAMPSGRTSLCKHIPINASGRNQSLGRAVQIGFEEFLDGRVDFAEVTKIIMDGMDELIYKEVALALKSSINQLPPANRVAAAGFDEGAMDRLISVIVGFLSSSLKYS